MKKYTPAQGLYESFEFVPGLLEALRIEGTYLCGGYVRNYVSGDALDNGTDADLFFSSKEVSEKAKETFLDNGYEVIFQCPQNLLTSLLHKGSGWKVQLIKIDYFSDIEKVLETFDFTVAMAGLD